MQCCSASQIGSPTVVAPAVDVASTSWPDSSVVVDATVDAVLDATVLDATALDATVLDEAVVDAGTELAALVAPSSEPHEEKRTTIATRPMGIRRMS